MPRHTRWLSAVRAPARLAAVAVVAVGLTAGAALTAVSPAGAEDYPLPTHEIGGLNKTVFHVGEQVVFTGTGYLPPGKSETTRPAPAFRAAFGTQGAATAASTQGSRNVVITDTGKPLGTAKVGPAGRFRFTFEYDTNATLGQHTLVARGIGANTAARDTTAVLLLTGITLARGDSGGATSSPGRGHLPFTGSDVRDLVLLGLALMLVGGLLVQRNLTARRDRRAARREARATAS